MLTSLAERDRVGALIGWSHGQRAAAGKVEPVEPRAGQAHPVSPRTATGRHAP